MKAAPATDKDLPPNVAELTRLVLAANPLHRRFLESALAAATAEEMDHLSVYMDFCLNRGIAMDYLAESYLTIVQDMLREQIYFQKHKKYRYSTFAEVADSVYFNDDYMALYMYGLALTSFLWPNHIAMQRFFLDALPRNKRGRYLDIGPGHGYFLMTAMKHSSYEDFLGIDISEASIRLTRDIVTHFCPEYRDNFNLRCLDFLDSGLETGSFDAIVAGEVIEHVERPDEFLKEIARLAKPDAWIFVTTCINAPAVDHIYLFGTPEQVDDMFRACGLRIKKSLILPYEGKTVEESLKGKLSVNVAYVLEKA